MDIYKLSPHEVSVEKMKEKAGLVPSDYFLKPTH